MIPTIPFMMSWRRPKDSSLPAIDRRSGAMRSIELRCAIAHRRPWLGYDAPSRNYEADCFVAVAPRNDDRDGRRIMAASGSSGNFRRSMPVRKSVLRDRRARTLGLA